MKKTKEEFNLGEIVAIFLPKLWIVAAVALIFALIVGGYLSFFKADTYSSTATLYVANEVSSTMNVGTLDVSREMVQRCEIAILSTRFLQKVVGYVREGASYHAEWETYLKSVDFVKNSITITQLQDTEYFNITVTTHDNEFSYALVNAVTAAVEKDLTEGDFLPYDSRYIKTRTINYANLPLNPDSKHEIRWSVVAGLCGAVLSMIVIFVHSLFDVTIYDKKKLEDSFSIPVLGVIPRFISEEGKE